jgi:hypothetical protein
VWIVKSSHRRHCLVYFRDQDKFAEANKNRLDLERAQQRT